MERLILVKYGEIHLKGLNRPYFKKLLRERLKENVGPADIFEQNGRVYVSGYENEEETIERIRRTFGVVGVSPAAIADKTMEDICAKALAEIQADMQQRGLQNATFKVKARRQDKTFLPQSNGICREVGGYILQHMPNVTVDVHTPQCVVEVEVRDRAYVYAQTLDAVGGLPVGCSGRATLLLSGGIDSPVAGYMMAKRGLSLDCAHFLSPPYTGEAARQKVIDLARILSTYTGAIDLHMVHFTKVQESIYETCRPDFMTIIMRRFMTRIAERLAQQHNRKAIVTGESLGQVASQTLDGICSTDSSVDMPIFRPLIGMDKSEIIEIARRIQTFETSIAPGEDCCTVFVPRHPATRPKLSVVAEEENKLDVEALIQQALEQTETLHITRD